MANVYQKAVEMMGFRVEPVPKEITPPPRWNTDAYEHWILVCPCEQKEYGSLPKGSDPYEMIWNRGSITPQHLINDGFPPEIVEQSRLNYANAKALVASVYHDPLDGVAQRGMNGN